MIKRIAHRIMNKSELVNLPPDWGIEFDVHAYGDKLVVAHDAFKMGLELEEFLKDAQGRFLAVNIKEEGIEDNVMSILETMNFKDFFLFDLSFPQIFRLGKVYSKNFAVRISQLEKINLKETRKHASYIWLDSFDGSFWPEKELISEIKNLSYKICFVSPLLHSQDSYSEEKYLKELIKLEAYFDREDFICTKFKL